MLTGGEDDHFFSVMSPGRGTSDMESSISSNLSGVSSRTYSTTPSCKYTLPYRCLQDEVLVIWNPLYLVI